MNQLILFINAGRSGSSYLYNIFSNYLAQEYYSSHESLKSNITLPKVNNRAYTKTEVDKILKENPSIDDWIIKVREQLLEKTVIEFGWTFAHLAPVLAHLFPNQFKVILLHRNPVFFAASRATMGNYYHNSFYNDKSHEISPFDDNSSIKYYKDKWNSMTPFEKCMYWWYNIALEGLEFSEYFPAVPFLIIKSEDIFNNKKELEKIIEFVGQNTNLLPDVINVGQNLLIARTYESFPLNDSWQSYKKHPKIIELAIQLGHEFNDQVISNKMSKYQIPNKFLPKLRSRIRYWHIKNKLRLLLKD